MGTTTSHELRCTRCGAHTLAAADWCSLCYADLRPPPEPEPAVEPEAPDAAPSGGKHARRVAPQQTLVTGDGPAGDLPADVDVDLMLAQLAAETSSPFGSLGTLMDRFDTKASRALVICGGVAAVGVLLLLGMTIMGSVL